MQVLPLHLSKTQEGKFFRRVPSISKHLIVVSYFPTSVSQLRNECILQLQYYLKKFCFSNIIIYTYESRVVDCFRLYEFNHSTTYFLVTNIFVERMSTDQKSCTICEYRHLTKPATDWCFECEQAFCSEYKVFHGFSRLSQNHATIPISDYVSLEASISSTTIICTTHNEICQMLCKTHDEILCLKCIDKHNAYVSKCITQIEEELKLHLQTINDDETNITVEIDTNRKKINDHLDKLEHDLRKNLSEKAAKSRNSIEETLTKLEDKQIEFTKTQKQMKDLEAYASDYQTYINLRQISSIIDSVESFLQSVVQDGNIEKETLILNFDDNMNTIDNIKQYGLINVQKKMCHVPLIRQKDKQAQLVGLGRPLVKGCEILTDGKIVFSNCGTETCAGVVIYDSNGKHLIDIRTKHDITCKDLACIANSTTIAISSGSKCINFVDINKQEVLKKRIAFKNDCYGVAYSDDLLLCSISGEGIHKICLDNSNPSTIVICDLRIGYVAVYNKMVYYTYPEKNAVTCCDMEGNCLWTFSYDTLLKKPRGISVDTRGLYTS
ncbi:PML [Mytilus edulis]|uniref:PML n=1 Tax=Mytilus edulis TaxID=6550 RepID=A0A8S3V673_MYTED|nr:PML [Mytilus edulis]